jgi:hypothetical protein
MLVEGLPRVIASSTSMLAPVSDWGVRLVSPLGSSLMSKDGMIELAGRVYWIVPLVIAAVLVARKYGYLMGRVTPPDSSSINPTRISIDLSTSSSDIDDDSGEVNAELTSSEDSIEDPIVDLPRMPGVIADDAGMDLEAIVDDQARNLRELREEVNQLRQRIEQQGGWLDQIEQRLEPIERQQRGSLETKQSR